MGLTLSRAPRFCPAPLPGDARSLWGIWERVFVAFPCAIPGLSGTIGRQLRSGFSSLEAGKSLQPFPQQREAPGIPSWESS